MKKIAVVILNFKVMGDTLECIASIEKSNLKNLKVIVVDNNSMDGLEEEINKNRTIEFIQTGKNLGYSGGNNVGVERALENDTDYIFIINPDAVVEKNTISNLAKELEIEDVGIVAPKILFFPEKQKIWYAGGKLDFMNVLGSHKGVNEKDSGQYNKKEDTDYASGAALMVKRQVFERIGLFDEKYFLYYEDADFCLRAKKAGFKIMYIPEAKVYHKNAHSTGLGSPLQEYFITRNRMLFAAKFLPLRTRFALFREALINLNNPVRRLAFFDFIIGNFGDGSFLK